MFLTCLCWPRRPTKRLKSWMISPGYFVALMSPACCLSSIIMRDGRASIFSWVRTTDVSPERVKTWAGQGSMKQHPQPQLNSPPFSYPGLPAPEGFYPLQLAFMEGDGRDLPRNVSSRLGSEMSPTSNGQTARKPKTRCNNYRRRSLREILTVFRTSLGGQRAINSERGGPRAFSCGLPLHLDAHAHNNLRPPAKRLLDRFGFGSFWISRAFDNNSVRASWSLER